MGAVMQHNRHVVDYLFSLPVEDRLAAYHELIEHRPPPQHNEHVVARRMPQHDEHVWEFRQLRQKDAHVEAYRVYRQGMWGDQCSHVHEYRADIVDGGPADRLMEALLATFEARRTTAAEYAARDAAQEKETDALIRELYGPFWYVERTSITQGPFERRNINDRNDL